MPWSSVSSKSMLLRSSSAPCLIPKPRESSAINPKDITSAINISVMGLTGEDGRYRAQDELAALHTTDHDARHITYCGGGIAASSNAFVMTRLGFTDVAVYTASLQEWTADPDLPMETVPTQ